MEGPGSTLQFSCLKISLPVDLLLPFVLADAPLFDIKTTSSSSVEDFDAFTVRSVISYSTMPTALRSPDIRAMLSLGEDSDRSRDGCVVWVESAADANK